MNKYLKVKKDRKRENRAIRHNKCNNRATSHDMFGLFLHSNRRWREFDKVDSLSGDKSYNIFLFDAYLTKLEDSWTRWYESWKK